MTAMSRGRRRSGCVIRRAVICAWRASICVLLCLTFLFVFSPSAVAQTAQELAREGFIAKDRRQYPLAVQLFGEALKRDQLTSEQRGLLHYGRGVSYEALGLRDAALSDLDAAIALMPNFPNSYIYRALIWSGRRELDQARDDLLQALRLKPDTALIYNNLGSVYESKGDVDLAVDNYGAAIRRDPTYAKAFYNRAHAYVAKQDYTAAIADYDRAIELQGDLADAYSNRGGVYLVLGEMEKAIKDFDEAIRLRAGDPIFWSNRASAYLTLGRYQEAIADFDRALKIDPGSPAIYLGRGRARLYSNAIPDAIEDLQVAVRLRPTNAVPAIWLHIARVHQGDADRAELESNAARVDRGQWPRSVLDFYLGTLEANRVRDDAARGSAAESARRLCEADFYIGDFLTHNGKDAEGRHILQTVITRCPPIDLVFAVAKAELSGMMRPQ